MEAIETTFTITESEYVRAMRRHNKTQIQFVRDVVAGVVALLIGICVLLFTESKLWAFALIVPSLILLLMIGYVKFVVPIKIYQAAK